ncbi:MAG: GTP-binding protein, partial [Candidatus Omnitrophica bacterium]|nr:GTP-binding protein [Candidatus Omnitrophota bacterium]
MRKTPKSLRLHIGLFGRTNVGKSSFLNMISSQDVAITSSLPGTTTDVVEKTMEFLPLGPVVFLDTGGLDDSSALSKLRIKKTKKIFDTSDIFVLIIESNVWGQYEDFVLNESVQRKLPCIVVINKIDIVYPGDDFIQAIQEKIKNIVLCSSIDKMNRDSYMEALKKELIDVCPEDFFRPLPLVADLLPAGGTAVLMIPIDLEAPKGRLILPQVQVLRDI